MKRRFRNTSSMHGFSLVELMIAMTIGLVILAGVSTLFVSSKQTYTTQDRLARLQENARFAMQFIIKDLRLAGYFGCISDITPDSMNITLNNSTDFAYNAMVPLEGLKNTTGPWYPSGNTTLPTGMLPGNDALAMRMGDPDDSTYLNQEMPNTSAVLKVNDIATLSVGEIIMISDCTSADIMQITQLNSTDPHILHNAGAGTPGNSTQKLSKAYSPSTAPDGTTVMKFKTKRYFIANGASGVPALFRQENTAAAVELVEGVERLNVLYGVDTDSDGTPNLYLKAGAAGLQSATEWSQVRSVRLGLLVRTVNNKDSDIDTSTYDIDGDGTTDFTPPVNDRNKRRVFQAVVQMRNLR